MAVFRNMKIAKKIISAFIVVVLMCVGVSMVGVVEINNVSRVDREMYENMAPMEHLSTIATNFEKIATLKRDIISATTKMEIEEYAQKITEIRALFGEHVALLEASLTNPDEIATYEKFSESRLSYIPLLDQVVELAKENKDEEAEKLLFSAEMEAASFGEQSAIEEMLAMKVAKGLAASTSNTTAAAMATLMIIVGGCVVAVLACIIGVILSRGIAKPLKGLVEVANKVADGDLDVRVDVRSRDEVGNLVATFKRMAENLNDVMGSVKSGSEQVSTGAKQVSDSSMALSQGATEQASAVEELTVSLEQISSQTGSNAKNATKASELAEKARVSTDTGSSQMQGMLTAMEEINSSSANIAKVIKVIEDIAFQTNILALNAAVEAARAGQHGKGFAVVAEEVRNLAARSSNAAKETTAMIADSTKNVENGSRHAASTASSLKEIAEEITEVSNLIAGIAVASNEQAAGINQVNQGIMQISQVVQSNSAISEQSAAASEELAGQAEELNKQLAKYRLRNEKSSALQIVSEDEQSFR